MENKRFENVLKVDHVRRRVDAVWAGTYDLNAVAHNCKKRMEEGAHSYVQFVDAREAEIARSFEDIRNLPRKVDKLVKQSTAVGPAGPTAVVVGRSIDFGMCRMIAAYFEPAGKIAVFYTPKEAENWLATKG